MVNNALNTQIPKHTVPHVMLGFQYQITYGLRFLINEIKVNNYSKLSIERLDDLSAEINEKDLALIELKHHLVPANLSDRSKDLWRTIREWADYILAGNSLKNTKLLLITTATATLGSIAHCLQFDQRDNNSILERLCLIAKEDSNQENISFYSAFLRMKPSDQTTLVEAIRIIPEQPNIEELHIEIKNHLRIVFSPDSLEKAIDELYGWWYHLVIKALLSKKVNISTSNLHNKIQDIRDWFNRRMPSPRYEEVIPPEDCPEIKPTMLYLRQLDLVKLSEARKTFAKRDFYRASCERSTWSSEEIINLNLLDSFDNRLREKWEFKWQIMKDEIGTSSTTNQKEEAGRNLYKWVETEANIPLKPEWPGFPEYLTRGSYHILANRKMDGCPRVGWHPEYDILLKDKTED